MFLHPHCPAPHRSLGHRHLRLQPAFPGPHLSALGVLCSQVGGFLFSEPLQPAGKVVLAGPAPKGQPAVMWAVAVTAPQGRCVRDALADTSSSPALAEPLSGERGWQETPHNAQWQSAWQSNDRVLRKRVRATKQVWMGNVRRPRGDIQTGLGQLLEMCPPSWGLIEVSVMHD